MATYYNISQGEIEAFLLPLGFQKIELAGVNELVYSRRIAHKLALSLRVFTGIEPTGASREVGKDAIRVCLFWRKPDGTITKASGSKRVHRVNGWKNNLKNRLDSWEQDFITCSVCGAPMIERTNRNNGNKFFGCCNYPNCKSIRPIKNVNNISKEKNFNYVAEQIRLAELANEELGIRAAEEALKAEHEVLRLEAQFS